MKIEITELFIKSLKAPESGRTEYSDTRRLGLRLRHYSPSTTHPKGKAVWMYEKRVKGGKKRKHTFGSWPMVSLSEARATALDIEAEAAKGIDRVEIAERERLELEAARAGLTTVQEVIDLYYELHLSTLRTGKDVKRAIEKALFKRLSISIKELESAHLQEAIDAKVKEGYRVYANRVRSMLLAFTHWAWRRKYLKERVGVEIPKAVKEVPRDRVITISEIRHIWETTYQMGKLWGPLLRLIILTGQRRGEIAKLQGSEIDVSKTQIMKRGSDTKNAMPHVTHLSPAAMAEIGTFDPLPEGYLFTTTGTTPVSGFSKMKVRLDNLLGDDFEPWTLHDVRTAMSTALNESGVPENIVDRIQNHQATGSAPSAVSRVYNQAQQLPERARALDKWAEIVTGEVAKVVQIGNF
ncbi:DUF4102 domain-containing protein [Amylibacter sp. SFDW26]|uniref:tyrosine-type recombinase/integrase n=1 Tax=Amylibacter sp. SFDW26 TaxID=2652722 RepID=UPI00126220F9|nr:integrase family protein [Amylibacter sp. SFDW26]KAB7610141.1 DUF4102 domain-containing protein [Amylibacter sp. SFDW26]